MVITFLGNDSPHSGANSCVTSKISFGHNVSVGDFVTAGHCVENNVTQIGPMHLLYELGT